MATFHRMKDETRRWSAASSRARRTSCSPAPPRSSTPTPDRYRQAAGREQYLPENQRLADQGLLLRQPHQAMTNHPTMFSVCRRKGMLWSVLCGVMFNRRSTLMSYERQEAGKRRWHCRPRDSARLELVRGDHALPDRPWAERALAGEKRVLEMIARGHSLCAILNALCLVVEEECPTARSVRSCCWTRRASGSGKARRPSLPQSYLAAFNGRQIMLGAVRSGCLPHGASNRRRCPG